MDDDGNAVSPADGRCVDIPAGAGDVPPGVAAALAALHDAVDVLAGADPATLAGWGAITVAEQLATATGRLTAARVRVLPVIEADGLWATTGAASFSLWVAHAHRLPVHTARAQVRLGRALRDHLPVTAHAVATGTIGFDHAQILAAHTPTTDRRCTALTHDGQVGEGFLVEQAAALGADQTRWVARRWAAAVDPDADDDGYTHACDREHLFLSRVGDVYRLDGQLTIEHGQVLTTALAALTPVPAADDTRTRGQRRAQALADLARTTLDHGLAGSGRTHRPHISVLVDEPRFRALIDAALHRSATRDADPHRLATRDADLHGDQVDAAHRGGATCPPAAGGDGGDHGPASAGSRAGRGVDSQAPDRTPSYATAALLTGEAVAGGPQFHDGTPVPRALLDRLACDSAINRIIFGPDSQVLDVGRTERTFTGPRRAALIARAKHCRYPTCTAPPALCEGHHTRHWARDHGTTRVDHGILLCYHHHDLVHRLHIEIHRHRTRWIFTDRHGRPLDPHHPTDDAAAADTDVA